MLKKQKIALSIMSLFLMVVFAACSSGPQPPAENGLGNDNGLTDVGSTPTTVVDTNASKIIYNAYATDTYTKEDGPGKPKTTFGTYEPVYIMYELDETRDYKKNPGYAHVIYYGNDQYVDEDIFPIDSDYVLGYFSVEYFQPLDGKAELYWCEQEDCSDKALAQTVEFTVE